VLDYGGMPLTADVVAEAVLAALDAAPQVVIPASAGMTNKATEST